MFFLLSYSEKVFTSITWTIKVWVLILGEFYSEIVFKALEVREEISKLWGSPDSDSEGLNPLFGGEERFERELFDSALFCINKFYIKSSILLEGFI